MSTPQKMLLIALFALSTSQAQTPAAPVSPPGPLPIRAGTYTVCHVGYNEAADKHLGLRIGDVVEVRSINLVSDLIFRRQGKALSMISIDDARALATTGEFVEAGKTIKHLITVVDETALANTYKEMLPEGCKPLAPTQRLIRIRYCVPTPDALGKESWACPGNRLPHGGDTHAKG